MRKRHKQKPKPKEEPPKEISRQQQETQAQHHLGQNLLAAIGLVAVEWSYLEGAVEACLLEFGGYQQLPARLIARVFTIHLQTISRLEALESIIRIAISEYRATVDELNAIIALNKRLNDLVGERNKVVHSIWVANPLATGILTARGKKMFSQNISPMSAGEVRDVAFRIATLTDDYRSLLAKRNASIVP